MDNLLGTLPLYDYLEYYKVVKLKTKLVIGADVKQSKKMNVSFSLFYRVQ